MGANGDLKRSVGANGDLNELDQPHRVIYKFKGRFTTKVFPNKEQALEFAHTQVDASVQLASEKPNIPKHRSELCKNWNWNKFRQE